MSEVILELGSTPRPAVARRLASVPVSSLADLWLQLNEEANRLGEIWAATRPSAHLGQDDVVDPDQLAEIVADHRRVSVGEAYSDIMQMSEAYDEIVQLSNGLHDIYRTLGARVQSGLADERDWDGYIDLADDLQLWRFNLTSRPGGDDRLRMGEPWAFDLTSRPGADDRLRMAGPWQFDLTSRPGGDDRLKLGQPPWCPYWKYRQQQATQMADSSWTPDWKYRQQMSIQLSGGFLKKITKGAGKILKKTLKVVKKALPLLIAAAATVVTGGAAAPMLGPAMAMSFGGKKKSAQEVEIQQSAADAVAATATMEQAGIEVPPAYANVAATAAQALRNSPGGEQALNASVQWMKNASDQAGAGLPVPGSAEEATSTVEAGTSGAGAPNYLLYGGIAAGGLLVVGMGLLFLNKLTS